MEGKTLLRRMVNRDGSADFKRKERYKQKLESVGLTPSDDLFMRDDGRRCYVVVAAYRVWQYICLFYRSPGNLKPTTSFNRAL